MTDIQSTIKSCAICQTGNYGDSRTTHNRQKLYTGRPWQKLAINLVGLLTEAGKGNRPILVFTDDFTRWQDALTIPDTIALVVIATLDKRAFFYLGLPEQIHMEQGLSLSRP